MARSVKRIGPSHLNERVAPAGWPHELRPLAVAFDEMLDRLEDSFRRLSQFSADLAHELRTPIANILGESQVALTRARTTDEYREVIESNVGIMSPRATRIPDPSKTNPKINAFLITFFCEVRADPDRKKAPLSILI